MPRATPPASPRRGWRQEHHLVAGGERDHLVRRLLLHAVDRPEQVVQLARGRDPEEAFHRLVGLVENAMGDVHGQPDEVAGAGREVLAVDQQVETALEDVDELVLRGMDMRRHEGARWECGVPGERILAQLLGYVNLAQDIPHDAVDTGVCLGHACRHRLHCARAPCAGLVALRCRAIQP